MTGVMAVGETPEKKQNQNTSQLHGSMEVVAQKTATQCVVADTMSSSFNAVENTNSQRKKPVSKLTGTCMIESGIHRSIFSLMFVFFFFFFFFL